jgi:hypothetical protein
LNLYQDGFINNKKLLYKEAKEMDSKITMAKVNEFLNSLTSYQLNRAHSENKEIFKTSWAFYPREVAQTDVMYLTDSKPRKEKYLLTYIDVYSRKAFVRLLKTRDADEIINALESIFKEAGVPKNIRFDNEFNKTVFHEFFEKHKVRMWPSAPYDLHHNGIVERFHRTLRGYIRSAQNAMKNNKGAKKSDYIPIIQKLVDNYNKTKHSNINAIPNKVFDGEDINHQKRRVVSFPYKEGDIVRHIEQRAIFDKKSSKNTYTQDKFIITRIENGRYFLRKESNKKKEEPFSFRGNDLVYAV